MRGQENRFHGQRSSASSKWRRPVRGSLLVVGTLFAFGISLLAVDPCHASWEFSKVSSDAVSLPTQQHPCDPTKWFQDRIRIRGKRIWTQLCADLRGDGIERMYAQLKRGPLIELELREDGPHEVTSFMAKRAFKAQLAVISIRGAKRKALVVNTNIYMYSFHWDGNSWRYSPVEEKQPAGVTSLVCGAFHDDRTERIYASFQNSIAEYSPSPVGWTRSVLNPNQGKIESLATRADTTSGRRALLVLTKGGKFAARWFPDRKVAVLNFVGRGATPETATAFSDLLRSRIVQIGNCKVLEREQIDKVMSELAFQRTGATDTQQAVKVGKLLNAERIVLGSVGKLEGKKYASVNIVDVETGEIVDAEYVRWVDRDDLERNLELLAEGACKKE